jgi:hypothetical protein
MRVQVNDLQAFHAWQFTVNVDMIRLMRHEGELLQPGGRDPKCLETDVVLYTRDRRLGVFSFRVTGPEIGAPLDIVSSKSALASISSSFSKGSITFLSCSFCREGQHADDRRRARRWPLPIPRSMFSIERSMSEANTAAAGSWSLKPPSSQCIVSNFAELGRSLRFIMTLPISRRKQFHIGLV